MKIRNRLIRLVIFALLLVAAGPALAKGYLFSTPDAAANAVKEIAAKIGGTPAVSLIDIGPDTVTLRAQGDKPFHVNEWRWQQIELWFLTRSFVSGPQAVQPSAPVDDVAASFFPLSEVKLELVPEVVAAAVKRAALEDAAEVTSIRIERQVSIFPSPQFGEPRWTVSVSSGRESATVYAALDGRIIGANLSGTQRARMFNLFTDDSHFDTAKTDLASVLGPDRNVLEVDVSKTDISVRAEHPSKKDYTVSYRWNLNGVQRDSVDSPSFRRAFDGDADVTFAFADLDLAVLPELKKAALDKLKLEGGTITRVEAEKRISGIKPPELVWVVNIEDAKGEKGQVIADTRGEILEIVLPESQRPKLEWLAGSTMRATLDRVFAKFPKDTKFRTILFNDERANIETEDPLKPGELASFIVNDVEITPFGTAFPDEFLDMGAGPPQRFTAEEMAGYDAATLDRLKERALERLNVKDGAISRLTFEKGNVFVASPRGNVLVEIRVDDAKGRNGGRVTYEPDGTELDVVLP